LPSWGFRVASSSGNHLDSGWEADVLEGALLVVSIGFLRGIVFAIAGVLVVGVIAAQIHLFRRRRRDSERETR